MLNNLLYNCSELYITNCRGGEGNVLWGKYFHDSSFDMKLTDIMFNMSYVAANCGSDIIKGGDIFKDEQLKANGTGGGHNGIKNIILNLHTEEFKRLKIGVGKDKQISIKDYVLSKFNDSTSNIFAFL